jgi:hypothetical protein
MASEELRERIIKACWSETEQEEYSTGHAWAEERAEDVLRAIEAAGYELVPKEQIEKLWRAVVAQEERERGEG